MLKDSRSDKPFDAAECSVPTVRASRRAAYAMFFADGIGFGIWAGHIPAFKQKFQLSDSSLSMVLLAVAAGCPSVWGLGWRGGGGPGPYLLVYG